LLIIVQFETFDQPDIPFAGHLKLCRSHPLLGQEESQHHLTSSGSEVRASVVLRKGCRSFPPDLAVLLFQQLTTHIYRATQEKGVRGKDLIQTHLNTGWVFFSFSPVFTFLCTQWHLLPLFGKGGRCPRTPSDSLVSPPGISRTQPFKSAG